ncbi:integrin beta-1-like [Corticium candelabrum]|uniref:integrin beta-1-like n=1 Tax=Corticium candelabrum TaxID=121492 RepID=UPI002E26F22B|nr:integrin beta-1-like [Corticium candelabrum]
MTRRLTISWLSTLMCFFSSHGAEDPCVAMLTCDTCISASPLCSWCQAEDFSGKARCRLTSSLSQISSSCLDVTVAASSVIITKNQPLSDEFQVSPQEVTVQLRPGFPVEIEVSVMSPQNYPVDLYLLVDISFTMLDDLRNIETLATSIIDGLKSRSENLRFGFGSFIDKPILPYTKGKNLEVGHIKCKDKVNCPAPLPYSFVNNLPLTDDPTELVETLKYINISGNFDDLEGGFDALLQAIVCKNEIGWRDKAHHLLVLVTDSISQHTAGDGKLAGIVKPHDGNCHLSGSGHGGIYTESLNLDYPSVGLLREKIQENDILVIYTTLKEYIKNHEMMSNAMPGVVIETLEKNSSNIVQLIHQTYDQIVSTIVPTLPHVEGLTVQVASHCNGNGVEKNGMECHNVPLGREVKFSIRLTATDCSLIDKLPSSFVKLQFVGFGTVYINVTSACRCACSDYPSPNASDCHSGMLVCGQCQCPPGRFGEYCNCTEFDRIDVSDCRLIDGDTLCSGHGTCVCQTCLCDEGYEGKFCQCNKAACQQDEFGKICGGFSQGECICSDVSKCNCKEGFTGESCSCIISEKECKNNQHDSRVCSGRGECKCGICTCNEGYRGEFCGLCESKACVRDECKQAEQCALCLAFGTDDIEDGTNCSFHCPQSDTLRIISSSLELHKNDTPLTYCSSSLDDCEYHYSVWVVGSGVQVAIESVCPRPKKSTSGLDSTFWVLIGIAGGVVAAAVLIIILWKIVTTCKDAAEYREFKRENETAKFTQTDNPLYKGPTTQVQNPTYERGSAAY